jgi:hypothetical protein
MSANGTTTTEEMVAALQSRLISAVAGARPAGTNGDDQQPVNWSKVVGTVVGESMVELIERFDAQLRPIEQRLAALEQKGRAEQ